MVSPNILSVYYFPSLSPCIIFVIPQLKAPTIYFPNLVIENKNLLSTSKPVVDTLMDYFLYTSSALQEVRDSLFFVSAETDIKSFVNSQ